MRKRGLSAMTFRSRDPVPIDSRSRRWWCRRSIFYLCVTLRNVRRKVSLESAFGLVILSDGQGTTLVLWLVGWLNIF